MNKQEQWVPKEDETVWRVSDLIASGSSDEVYKAFFWSAVHNGFNLFRTKEDAEKARDKILKILSSRDEVEEQRIENEKALEALNFVGRKCETRFSAFDDELWDKFETIKAALESV